MGFLRFIPAGGLFFIRELEFVAVIEPFFIHDRVDLVDQALIGFMSVIKPAIHAAVEVGRAFFAFRFHARLADIRPFISAFITTFHISIIAEKSADGNFTLIIVG